MTSSEFHIAIDLELDKTLDFEYPYIQPEEKDYWLNKAQDRILSQKLFGNNIKGVPFDLSLERIDDIQPLIKNESINGTSSSIDLSPYIKEFKLPSDYKYYIKSFVISDKVMRSGYKALRSPLPVDIISRDSLHSFVTYDGVNKPDFDSLKGILEDGKLIIVHDSYTSNVDTCKLSYIKTPKSFNYLNSQVSDLPDHVHRQILDEAVLLLINNFESNRLQQQIEINSKNE